MFVEAGEGEFVVSGKGLGRECGRGCGGVVFARGLRGGTIPSFEILDPGYAFLCVADHFAEEVGEAGAAELAGARAVEVPVIDCFAVGGSAEAWGRGWMLEGCEWGSLGALSGVHYGYLGGMEER